MSCAAPVWRTRSRLFHLEKRIVVMGVLNLTPDSFSDGGVYSDDPQAAVEAAGQMIADGADLIDIGGESTRPGRAETVSPKEECRRVLPVLRAIRESYPEAVLSVDTYKLEVMREALDAGADVINDVYALQRAPAAVSDICRAGAGVILMHMLGDPETMQSEPSYRDAPVEIRSMLQGRVDFCLQAGIAAECVAVDPGIGFGKALQHNLDILANLSHFAPPGFPVCMGASRKGFLGVLTGGLPVTEREEATIAACTAAALNGAGIVRVHNVRGVRRAMDVAAALRAAVRSSC